MFVKLGNVVLCHKLLLELWSLTKPVLKRPHSTHVHFKQFYEQDN